MVILGIVFLLQSKSVVGPSASFMYSNPVWTVNGSIITGTGLFVVAIGVVTTILYLSINLVFVATTVPRVYDFQIPSHQ